MGDATWMSRWFDTLPAALVSLHRMAIMRHASRARKEPLVVEKTCDFGLQLQLQLERRS